jgi:hypothetical protein
MRSIPDVLSVLSAGPLASSIVELASSTGLCRSHLALSILFARFQLIFLRHVLGLVTIIDTNQLVPQ